MALPEEKKRQLRKMLRSFAAANGTATLPAASGKALEAWIFMRLAMAAKASGLWSVTLRQGDGSLLPSGATFHFTMSQTGIQPWHLNSPCYVLIESRIEQRENFELHGSLQWQGRSFATHEVDVSAIPGSVANALRAIGGGLPRGLPIAAIECKDRTTTGTPDEMRQTLARMFDLVLVTPPPAPTRQCRIYAPGTTVTWGERSKSYRAFYERGTFAIARAGLFSSGAEHLGEHYYILRCGSIYHHHGIAIADLEQSFVDTLARSSTF